MESFKPLIAKVAAGASLSRAEAVGIAALIGVSLGVIGLLGGDAAARLAGLFID